MLTPEQKDELRLWHGRLESDPLKWSSTHEFREMSQRCRRYFAPDPNSGEQTALAEEVKAYLKELKGLPAVDETPPLTHPPLCPMEDGDETTVSSGQA